MEPRPVIAVDVGGTKIAAGIVRGGEVSDLARLDTPPRPKIADLVGAVGQVISLVPDGPGPIAVATAGLVRAGALRALNDKFDVPDWQPFEQPLRQALGRSVVLLNDAQAATWGEFRYGAGMGASSIVFLTISTGIGGGIVVNGRLLEGHQGLAGSIGQIWLDPGDPSSSTLESKASGSGLAQRAAGILQRPIAAQEVLASKEPSVRFVATDMARLVAGSIANLAATIDPEIVVIGGGVGLAPGIVDMIAEAMEGFPSLYRPNVTPAALGHEAGLVGCADWLLRRSDGSGAGSSIE